MQKLCTVTLLLALAACSTTAQPQDKPGVWASMAGPFGYILHLEPAVFSREDVYCEDVTGTPVADVPPSVQFPNSIVLNGPTENSRMHSKIRFSPTPGLPNGLMCIIPVSRVPQIVPLSDLDTGLYCEDTNGTPITDFSVELTGPIEGIRMESWLQGNSIHTELHIPPTAELPNGMTCRSPKPV